MRRAGRWESLQELICFGLWKAELLNIFLRVHLWWNATDQFHKIYELSNKKKHLQ